MKKALVAYFSASGTTAKLASALAAAANGELFEIRPLVPYSAADLKWTNPLSRCNREKIGKKTIPLASSVENWADFDTVFLGFPIWYYGAPNVIESFAKSYDWSGKTVVLFATSGGSNIGKTAEKLLPFLNGCGAVADARVFSADVAQSELSLWAKRFCQE
ncbi:MAG: NAD(P)H-dependent oxidoreductase [Clostridia bacterium]|nr:NAD(P)H-dependent oxidoreductase [Clostridia bacterium]